MKQEQRAQMMRDRIMKAAMEVFGTRGYDGGTVGEICRQGINKGLVYHYYESKDALYLECLRVSCGKLQTALQDMEEAGSGTASQIVRRYMDSRMVFSRENPLENHILFEALLTPPAHLRGDIAGIMQPLDSLNTGILRSALSKLTLRQGVDIEQAMQYFSMLQTMFNGYYGSPSMQTRSLEERIREHEKAMPAVIDFMLYGIAQKEEG